MRKTFSLIAALWVTMGFAQRQDVNEDGVVNSSDVVEVYNYIIGGGSSGGGAMLRARPLR